MIGEHSAVFDPAISTTSAFRMSSDGLALRSMPQAFLFGAPALTMQRQPS
jgi:hypothetical protein